MPKERKKVLCMDAQRHAEYYGMQQTFDELYAKSKAGEVFNGLMELVLSPDNSMLAYRNIKTNTGSYTAGTDKQNIGDIGRLPPAEVIGKVRKIVTGSEHGYRPKPVRRKDIPKPNGKTRPLGIPCIWDRLVQQCIKQILEPICEAKFSNNSYGFRPNRSVEHAISRTYSLLQRAHLHYVLEFDIKGFFDNVNHSKLIRQLWALGIQDKQLLFVIKRILKAPIRMPDGSTVYPTKGIPQGGIISPLLANVVLNELDHWVDSQWVEHPVANRYGTHRIIRTSEVFDKSKGYQKMRETNLKEMFIVRYADDFRIFCRNREDAEKTMEAVTKWITERLKLEVSPEKTRIVNVRKRYSEFLGFKIMVYRKGEKYVVKSHICDKKLHLEESKLVEQAKRIAKPAYGRTQPDEIGLFDEMVLGIQNYYRIATCISLDCRKIHRRVMTVLTNRLNTESGCQLTREGGAMTDSEKEHYGASQMVRYVSGINRPIYPIAFIKYKTAIGISAAVCCFSPAGRKKIHDNLEMDTTLFAYLRENPPQGHSLEYADCRLSLLSAQKGKCSVSGELFLNPDNIVCHMKVPKEQGGHERYSNLVLLHRRYAKHDRAEFVRVVQEAQSSQQTAEVKKQRTRLATAKQRVSELEVLLCKIYEDNILGKLSDSRYATLDAQYAKEQAELTDEISALEKAIRSYEKHEKDADRFIALIGKYENFDKLTIAMLNEFIEKILVHERDRKGSIQTTQEVEIYFNFVGRFVPPAFGEVELTPEELEEIRKREERKDRLHQNYLKRKASGAQKRYEDKIKERKKAEIEAKKAAIRAEDIAKGVFVPVSSLPQREPMKGVQSA